MLPRNSWLSASKYSSTSVARNGVGRWDRGYMKETSDCKILSLVSSSENEER